MNATKAQLQAITHNEGPAMILAGPGSGKTTVITGRIRNLIEKYKVNPRDILVITFTKAAAVEMKERFLRMSAARGVTFGTFHAVFFGILKHAYHYTAANILREEQKYRILSELTRQHRIAAEDEKQFLSDLIAEISTVKNERIDLNHYYSSTCPEDVFREIFRKYEAIHRKQGLIDFDDMLTYSYELLRERPDIRAGWQQRFRYILVDEFQDINALQYEIVRMLAAPQDNLFIVGDDDQSIYRFRGAKPEIMLNFPKDYPRAKVIELDCNFRSTPSILNCALYVIQNNSHRFRKNLHAVRPDGPPVNIQEFRDQEHEILYILKCIKNGMEHGRSGSDFAILFRTNQAAQPFAERLLEFNLPFVMRDTLPNVYEHWIARDLFAYLHLALVQTDRKEFLQVMNRPKRYIARDCIDSAIVSFETLRMYHEGKDWMIDRIDRMETDLRILRGMKPYAAVNYIRFGIGYEGFLKEYANQRRIKEEELIDILNEIQDGSKPFESVEDWLAHIEEYKKAVAEKARSDNASKDAVTLATLHSSKGLEFKEVFLVDVNEGIIPHKKATLETDIEEERRLFYVGMTRARDRLHLFYVREKHGNTAERSEFLDGLVQE